MHSTEQREIALARATENRLGRAALRKRSYSMDRYDSFFFVAGLLEDPPASIRSMRIERLANRWIPQFGTMNMKSILTDSGVFNPLRRISDLTDDQRGRIARHLRAWGERDRSNRFGSAT